ncbi:hypothetical protein HYU45_02280 [Candidatus Daviesbacteria bacterium]|nr:hypothetical protein [Candidatus Daviesbacteria bacterium]
MILHIDTKDQKVVKVSLRKEGKIIKSLSESREYGSQVLLPLIFKLLRTSTPGVSSQFHSRSGQWKDLKGIDVETGPGSFTGLRVGVSVANALGFALGISVNGKKIETDLSY